MSRQHVNTQYHDPPRQRFTKFWWDGVGGLSLSLYIYIYIFIASSIVIILHQTIHFMHTNNTHTYMCVYIYIYIFRILRLVRWLKTPHCGSALNDSQTTGTRTWNAFRVLLLLLLLSLLLSLLIYIYIYTYYVICICIGSEFIVVILLVSLQSNICITFLG